MTKSRAVKKFLFTQGLANSSRRGDVGRLLAYVFVFLLASCQPKVEHGGKHPIAQVNAWYDSHNIDYDYVYALINE